MKIIFVVLAFSLLWGSTAQASLPNCARIAFDLEAQLHTGQLSFEDFRANSRTAIADAKIEHHADANFLVARAIENMKGGYNSEILEGCTILGHLAFEPEITASSLKAITERLVYYVRHGDLLSSNVQWMAAVQLRRVINQKALEPLKIVYEEAKDLGFFLDALNPDAGSELVVPFAWLFSQSFVPKSERKSFLQNLETIRFGSIARRLDQAYRNWDKGYEDHRAFAQKVDTAMAIMYHTLERNPPLFPGQVDGKVYNATHTAISTFQNAYTETQEGLPPFKTFPTSEGEVEVLTAQVENFLKNAADLPTKITHQKNPAIRYELMQLLMKRRSDLEHLILKIAALTAKVYEGERGGVDVLKQIPNVEALVARMERAWAEEFKITFFYSPFQANQFNERFEILEDLKLDGFDLIEIPLDEVTRIGNSKTVEEFKTELNKWRAGVPRKIFNLPPNILQRILTDFSTLKGDSNPDADVEHAARDLTNLADNLREFTYRLQIDLSEQNLPSAKAYSIIKRQLRFKNLRERMYSEIAALKNEFKDSPEDLEYFAPMIASMDASLRKMTPGLQVAVLFEAVNSLPDFQARFEFVNRQRFAGMDLMKVPFEVLEQLGLIKDEFMFEQELKRIAFPAIAR